MRKWEGHGPRARHQVSGGVSADLQRLTDAGVESEHLRRGLEPLQEPKGGQVDGIEGTETTCGGHRPCHVAHFPGDLEEAQLRAYLGKSCPESCRHLRFLGVVKPPAQKSPLPFHTSETGCERLAGASETARHRLRAILLENAA